MRLVLDAGHGGKDPGAVSGNLNEKDINLIMAKKCRDELFGFGHYVILTRESDTYPSLEQRAKLANNLKADLFVSFHCNSAITDSAQGFEVWTSVGDTAADKYAEEVINQASKSFPDMKLRRDLLDGDSDKERDFSVLVDTNCPAILIEIGFINNQEDRAKISDPVWQDKMVKAVVAAINLCCAQTTQQFACR